MESVRETIRKLYATLETDLDANEMIGKLQSNGLIGVFQREQILSKSNRIEKNRVILDHVQLFDEKNLRSFCDVLSTCNPPSGTSLAQRISDKLDAELGMSTQDCMDIPPHTLVYSVLFSTVPKSSLGRSPFSMGQVDYGCRFCIVLCQ